MERLKIAVLASGSGSNLQAIIDEIKSGFLPVELALVLSDKPQAYALQRAKAAGVPTKVLLPADFASREDYDAELVRLLKASGAEAVALAGYMRLVTPVFLQAFPHRVLNIHPALLPSFPGLHGQRQAFEYGVKVAGCTVHFVDEGMDSGPIILQAPVPVLEDDDADSLAARILEQEHIIYPLALRLLAEGKLHIEGRRVRIAE
ncbi:MAG: phosphoribosylglycinamide formyltransferase [Peptococcaceae bacterium]|nr:phosphoribosylglycinamide formyltransferase [Peptococcaceae bacterium]